MDTNINCRHIDWNNKEGKDTNNSQVTTWTAAVFVTVPWKVNAAVYFFLSLFQLQQDEEEGEGEKEKEVAFFP